MKKFLNKRDCMLIMAVLFMAAVSLLAVLLFWGGSGQIIRITVDGELFGEYSLSDDQTVEVAGPYGKNSIVIEHGAAYMDGADCPDKYCMRYAPISKENETIICLPHRLVVEVTEEKIREK